MSIAVRSHEHIEPLIWTHKRPRLWIHKPPRYLRAETAEERAFDLGARIFQLFLANPQQDPKLHNGVLAIFLPEDDPEVARLNLEAARRARRRGQLVEYRFIDPSGNISGGVQYQFTIDLRDERWGSEPQTEFKGRTAAEMRAILHETIVASQEIEPVRMRLYSDQLEQLDKARIYILDEPEPGLYECLAFQRQA